MAGSALKRLMAEYKQLSNNPPEGIVAGPKKEENFFEWECYILGPEGTPFEDGVFTAELVFPTDYPMSPPKMKFVSDILHPNGACAIVVERGIFQDTITGTVDPYPPLVYPDGRVCISILHTPGDDPMGYELPVERWSPVQSVEKVLLSVVSMLAEPNDESPANVDAAKLWRNDRKRFNEIADHLVKKTLGLS